VNYDIFGISQVDYKYIETTEEPTIPGKWALSEGYDGYYVVKLKNYSSFYDNPKLSEFLSSYSYQLNGIRGSFFTSSMKAAQKYLVKIDRVQFNYIQEYLFQKQIKK
jgi:hypothetical protein